MTSTADLQSRFQRVPKNFPVNKNRLFLRSGVLYLEEDKKIKPRFCFLFNDVFIETKPECEFNAACDALVDPNSKFRLKHFLLVDDMKIDQSARTSQIEAKNETQTQNQFILMNSHDYNPATKSKTEQKTNEPDKPNTKPNKSKQKNTTLIFSAPKKERELWLNDIHTAIVHSIGLADAIQYAWQTNYRLGTIFDAVSSCNEQLFKQLVQRYPKIEQLQDHGHNLLHIAASVNNVSFIEEYGERFEVDATDCNGWTALRIACDHGHLESTRIIVESLWPDLDFWYPEDKTIDVTKVLQQESQDDRSLLHELVVQSKIELMPVLLKAQINMESVDQRGYTPLHLACKQNDQQAVICLLQHGSHVNLPDWKGNRPLHLCTKVSIARWLVAFGARFDLANRMKRTGRDIWVKRLDKFLVVFAKFGEHDCKIQTNVSQSSWFDDQLSDNCLCCNAAFTFTMRKHHCRACGLLVCKQCSSRKLLYVSKGEKQTQLQRACDKCFNRALCNADFINKYEFGSQTQIYSLSPKEFMKLMVLELHVKGSYQTILNQKQMKLAAASKASEMKSQDSNSSNRSKIINSDAYRNNNSNYNSNSNSNSNMAELNSAHATLEAANMRAAENVEKLKELNIKSSRMADSAQKFNQMAKQLEKQQKQRSTLFNIF